MEDQIQELLEQIRRAGLVLGTEASKRTGNWARIVESEGLGIAHLASEALEVRSREVPWVADEQ